MNATPARTVTLHATHEVQTEPLLADQWLPALNPDGHLVAEVANEYRLTDDMVHAALNWTGANS